MTRSPEETVRSFFACYSDGRPDDFDECVAGDYLDYGHEPPGEGPDGARADYDHAVAQVNGIPRYTIDALLSDDDAVAAAWTGRMPDGSSMRGFSLYRVRDGLLRSTRHTKLQPDPAG